MKKLVLVLVILFSVSLFAENKAAGVKLGVAAGWSYSDMPTKDDMKIDEHNNVIWGFYVDIPVISTFNLVPSALLYKVNLNNQELATTDISLSAKFKIPLAKLTAYVLATGGLTQIQLSETDGISSHVGFGGGVSLNLVSNISFFAEGNYRMILTDDGNIKNYFISTGFLWGF